MIGLIRVIKIKFIYVNLFFSSPQMWYNKKPAHSSITSRLLKKKSPRFEINMQQKAESTVKATIGVPFPPTLPTDRSYLCRPWYLFAILNCFQNVGTKDFGSHFWIAGNVVRDSQTVMHTKSLWKKSAMVYGSTRADRKFHYIIGNHRYDFSQEIPSHIYCFVTELGLTQSLP